MTYITGASEETAETNQASGGPCRTFLPQPTGYPTATLPHIQPCPTLSYPI